LIEIENISKAFGGIQAVDGCSFTIRKGGITGLIGPNGAGKSTLFSIIAGFQQPNAGAISLEGRNIVGVPPHRLFHEGLVRTFQIPHEFTRMTVRENLMVVPPHQYGENLLASWFRWSRVKQQDREILDRVDDVLEFLKLAPLADEQAGNLSGGQKKLLELGRTMMTDARIVLLDEPGAGVNPTLMTALSSAIKRLNTERGYTFCLIEHDMDLVTELCDPIVCMADGRVIAEGSMTDIRANELVRSAYLGDSEAGKADLENTTTT